MLSPTAPEARRFLAAVAELIEREWPAPRPPETDAGIAAGLCFSGARILCELANVPLDARLSEALRENTFDAIKRTIVNHQRSELARN